MLSLEHRDAEPGAQGCCTTSERLKMQPINLGSRQDAELGEFPVPRCAAVRGWLVPGRSRELAPDLGLLWCPGM